MTFFYSVLQKESKKKLAGLRFLNQLFFFIGKAGHSHIVEWEWSVNGLFGESPVAACFPFEVTLIEWAGLPTRP